jgi:hypothetical protein
MPLTYYKVTGKLLTSNTTLVQSHAEAKVSNFL